jgi:hypothetical protein
MKLYLNGKINGMDTSKNLVTPNSLEIMNFIQVNNLDEDSDVE